MYVFMHIIIYNTIYIIYTYNIYFYNIYYIIIYFITYIDISFFQNMRSLLSPKTKGKANQNVSGSRVWAWYSSYFHEVNVVATQIRLWKHLVLWNTNVIAPTVFDQVPKASTAFKKAIALYQIWKTCAGTSHTPLYHTKCSAATMKACRFGSTSARTRKPIAAHINLAKTV